MRWIGPPVIAGTGPEDIVHKRLRVAVIEREPAGLDLHHDAVAGQEDMVGDGQGEAVAQRQVGGNDLASAKLSR